MPTTRLDLGDLTDFLAKLAENSQDVYWLSSADFSKIAYISPAYEEIWGRPRETLYQHPEEWINYLHPDDVKDHHPILAMKERVEHVGGSARYRESYRIVRPNGEVRWIIDRGFPIMDPSSGRCLGVTGVAIDVTEQRLLQEEKEKAHEELVAAHELKMRFIRDMQHDIRTPFTGLWGLAHALLQIETDPEKREMVQMIESAAKQLLDYCNKILEFNKAGDTPVLEEKLDLKELLEGLIAIEIPAAEIKRLKLSLEMEDIPSFIWGDYTRLKSLLINLVSNAIKFTQVGYVKLIARQAKKISDNKIILQFIIEDSGIGIPEEKQKYIYEKYFRVEPANTGKYSGTGLGLSIVKNIIHDLEGDIEVISELNKGTRFICSFPARIPLVD